MSRVLIFFLAVGLAMAANDSTSSNSQGATSLGAMAAPGWQSSDVAEMETAREVNQQLRERLREFIGRQNVTVERDVVYAERGEDKLLLDVYQPKTEGPHAAVLVVHGGAWRSGSKAQLMAYAREIASRGHVAFAINYRLAPDHIFPAQIDDCREAVRFIVANAEKYSVDPERLGAIGYSAGGHLVALLGTQGVSIAVDNAQVSDDADAVVDATNGTNGEVAGESLIRLRAVAPGGAPCDFRGLPANMQGLAFWLGGTPGEKAESYNAASPAAFVTKEACPMFFFHGESDELVNLSSPKEMMAELKKAGVENEIHVVEGAGHIAAAMDMDALKAALDFLDGHLDKGDGSNQ